MMRSVLMALIAFVAGAVLVFWLPRPVVISGPLGSPTAGASSAFLGESTGTTQRTDWPEAAPTPEQVLYAQPRLLREAFAHLGARVAGKPNLYLVTFAGDGGEDVFRNEAEYAAQLFRQRFGVSTHTVVLANNPASLDVHPLASWSNLEAVLDGLAGVMHTNQDILMVYLTSHGDEDHTLLVDLDPLPLDQIQAQNLADILHKQAFRWKVIVVNACYSGGFVPPLRSPGTLILTAARSDRSSFGCGSDSDITYFGKAWLVDAMNHSDHFVDAFHQASRDISAWEQQDKLTPSEPQIDIGSGIQDQLARWRKGITPGPSVPFKPSATPAIAAPLHRESSQR